MCGKCISNSHTLGDHQMCKCKSNRECIISNTWSWIHYGLPSMGGAGKLGTRFAIIAAFPLWRRTPSLDQVWLIASPSSWPLCLAKADASLFTWRTATSCHPPKVSAARGRKTMPSDLQASAAPTIFLSKATSAACPGLAAAWWYRFITKLVDIREGSKNLYTESAS